MSSIKNIIPRPTVSNIVETDEELSFECDNINVSIMNSIRRVILSEINTVVVRTEPYEKCDVNIIKNVSRINNEMLKQRLSCIPIHINDESISIEDYIIELDVKNEENSIRLVTTEDFKIKNIKTGTYLRESEVRNIFPANKFTGDYIAFTRLQPKLVTGKNTECIHLEAKMTRSNAKENGAFNVASCCSYMMTPDVLKQREELSKYEEAEKAKGNELTEEQKKDWELLEAQRIYKKDSFNFTLETTGVYTNVELIKKACKIMKDKLQKISNLVKENRIEIVKGKNSMDCMDIILDGEDYTLGKALEYSLYKMYFEDVPLLNYVGFNKFHPHDDYSVIRVSKQSDDEDSKTELTKEETMNLLDTACDALMNTYNQLEEQF